MELTESMDGITEDDGDDNDDAGKDGKKKKGS